MSVKAMAWVWDQDLPRDEKFLLLAYADHADHEGNNIFPAVQTIAQKTGYSERSVQRITKKLIDDGWLIECGTSKYQTNKYRMPIYGGDKMTPQTSDDRGDILTGGDTGVTGGVTKSTQRGDIAMTPDPSLTIIKPSIDAGANGNSKPKKKGDLLDGILKYANRGEIDLSDFPEDVRGVIQTYCELYNQYPPRKSKKGEFALWIADARDLLDAGGAMTIQTMRDLKEKPYKWMGEAMIGRPGALVKAVRARAGEVSIKPVSEMTTDEFVKHMLEKEKQNAGNSVSTERR